MSFDWTAAVAIPPALVAALSVYAAVRTSRSIVRLPAAAARREPWPRVTVVVPACNEASTLEAATKAKLESDYPNLEILIVEDRSTDETPAIADRLAEGDPRVTVVHVRELPNGWLGKLHALDCGVKAASGAWILLSDADVHLSSTVIRRAVSLGEAEAYDFIAAIPHLLPAPFFLDVTFATFMRQILTVGRAWQVADPRSNAAAGSGVFNLIRRAAYDKTEGLAELRMEAADDVALGQTMKKAGLRCQVFNGRDDVRLTYFSSLREMTLASEKNGFAVLGRFRVGELVVGTALILYVEASPLAMLALGSPLARAIAGLTLVTTALAQLLVARYLGRGVASSLVPIVGPMTMLYMFLRASILTLVRGGIVWRGTKYALADLRRGSRITFL